MSKLTNDDRNMLTLFNTKTYLCYLVVLKTKILSKSNKKGDVFDRQANDIQERIELISGTKYEFNLDSYQVD